MLVNLSLGGIPGYLKQIEPKQGVKSQITRLFFTSNGHFYREFDKIFVSSLSHRKHYREIIDYLALHRFATREQINKDLKISEGPLGGTYSQLFLDLEECEFIRSYSPIHLNSNENRLIRYTISDEYWNFYFRMVKPVLKKIKAESFDQHPEKAINQNHFSVMLGLAFERWCCKN